MISKSLKSQHNLYSNVYKVIENVMTVKRAFDTSYEVPHLSED